MSPTISLPLTGFIGLGLMGEPMALNLQRSYGNLTVWNRTKDKTQALRESGAKVVDSPAALFAQVDVVILMLSSGDAIDEVLARGSPDFAARVAGKLILNTGTMSPEYSDGLAQAIVAAGGRYVEAPVSGSRAPAESGHLVGMLAGDDEDCRTAMRILAPTCSHIVRCGAVPAALRMKLAVNIHLITLVTGLAEAWHFAESHRLDTEVLKEILDAGPMASDVSRIKARKLLNRDLSPQASIADVLKNNDLIVQSARSGNIPTPLMNASRDLYARTLSLGFSEEDMAAVIRAFSNLSSREDDVASSQSDPRLPPVGRQHRSFCTIHSE